MRQRRERNDLPVAQALQSILYAAVVATSVLSVYFSFRSRRADTVKKSAIYAARMNICMGIMLICIALIQILLFDSSTVRVIVGTVFLLLGLFNLFAGLRNHMFYSR
jgi:hypothetical protein